MTSCDVTVTSHSECRPVQVYTASPKYTDQSHRHRSRSVNTDRKLSRSIATDASYLFGLRSREGRPPVGRLSLRLNHVASCITWTISECCTERAGREVGLGGCDVNCQSDWQVYYRETARGKAYWIHRWSLPAYGLWRWRVPGSLILAPSVWTTDHRYIVYESTAEHYIIEGMPPRRPVALIIDITTYSLLYDKNIITNLWYARYFLTYLLT